MESWATKRRLIYGGAVLLLLLSFFILGFFKFFYEAPTCFDGRKNGDERGVDCGGKCINLCSSDALNPIIIWSKAFNISGDVYTAVAYVENPNISSKNRLANYQFKIYDDRNALITVIDGQTSIPKNKRFAVFETGIVLRGQKPKNVDFEFTSFSNWERDEEPEPQINIEHSVLLNATTSPRITGTITNDSVKTIPGLELAVLILDGNENVVAASRSFVDSINPRSGQDFVFTWPRAFDLGVEACLNPVDVIVALDRSGSMRSESANPPEPFSTVVSTAKDFINNLKESDQVGVVSFGNEGSIESVLSNNKQDSINAIGNLSLSDNVEQTNIFGGLNFAFAEFNSNRVRNESEKAIVLLTDGVPTEPKNLNIPDWPAISAQNIAEELKSNGVEIYTIGLGSSIGEGFLRTISSDNSHYYYAPKKEDLSDIYEKIGSSLCVKKPNVITIIYRPI